MIKKIPDETLQSLNKSEFDVLGYISNNTDKCCRMTISQLAKENFVSTTTVVRLCKKLGYSGFSEFKYDLKRNIREKEQSNIIEYDKSVETHLMNIQKTCELLSEDTVNKIAQLLMQKKIHFFGKGLSRITCEYITDQIIMLNRLAINYTSTHIAYLSGEKMDENDVVFVLSLSGETFQTLKLAKIAKSKGATVVSITCMGMNSLAKVADINLYVYSEDVADYGFDNKSRASVLLLFQIIFDAYIKLNKGIETY